MFYEKLLLSCPGTEMFWPAHFTWTQLLLRDPGELELVPQLTQLVLQTRGAPVKVGSCLGGAAL